MSEIPRTFVSEDYIDHNQSIIFINDIDEIHHLKNVLRIKENDIIHILDNQGNIYFCHASTVSNKEITCLIDTCELLKPYPSVNIRHFQSIIKSDRQDFIIQKLVEMGVSEVICFPSEYSNFRINNKNKLQKKLTRWNKIALNASKQSKRSTFARVLFYESLEKALETVNTRLTDLNISLVETHKDSNIKQLLKKYYKKPETINIFTGPEGGWSDQEKELFLSKGIYKVNVGSNILRAETAAILITGIILYEYEF
jgi:16S rRNA (uracil1498-N3)-methyltransferase